MEGQAIYHLEPEADGDTTSRVPGDFLQPAPPPARARHPVPAEKHWTRTQVLLSLLLRLAALEIKQLHPSEQVGWLVYLLQQLESQFNQDEFSQFPPILTALQQDIVRRLLTGSY